MKVKEKNYTPDSISFAMGFLGPMGDVGFHMVADYAKAKQIIKSLIKENRDISHAEMGLDGDWNENSMTIYEDGKHEKYNRFKSSIWAEPLLIVYFNDGPSEAYSVWKRENKE